MVNAIKDVIRDLTGLPDPVLHVLIGLAIFFLSALVLRKSLRSWWPFLVVAALQGINELADMAGDIVRYNDVDVRGTVGDTVLTLLIPWLIVIGLRMARPDVSEATGRGAPGDQR